MSLDNAEKQKLREAVIEYLAKRSTMRFGVSAMTRGVKKAQYVDFPISEADIAEALAVLVGFGFVKEILPKLGSIRDYQITSDGVVFYERQDG